MRVRTLLTLLVLLLVLVLVVIPVFGIILWGLREVALLLIGFAAGYVIGKLKGGR